MDKNTLPNHLANHYVRCIDQRCFGELEQIMWPEFSQRGPGFAAESREQFIGNLGMLEHFSHTFHMLGSQFGEWQGGEYRGETYCVASHFYERDGRRWKMDMGIRYHDVIVLRDGIGKYLSRDLTLVWQEDRPLEVAQ
ncbi:MULTISPECIES: nuclear transport factor 2 family protein [Spongiibacter]|uniref:nuclear transport factor 2 family protein n=1 Tax=Spongiibacter TaxID=630749 RepID=UPI000C38AF3F|nr:MULTISPECIES: nuclear transport factor 2 family protein [Spongiibacter]MAY37526.1 hypothetical protein [Spongiibacter sp.]MBI58270.1 hypothetical protein [Spongiibacter sp.]MBO6752266.1 nuclear transport factor 2 family protein [Spongiibacter sp.]|tara:strand:+ start:1688 stop:2101 length:414 start_codon:yes stop_codon:yes gene_type:complete